MQTSGKNQGTQQHVVSLKASKQFSAKMKHTQHMHVYCHQHKIESTNKQKNTEKKETDITVFGLPPAMSGVALSSKLSQLANIVSPTVEGLYVPTQRNETC